MHLRTATRSLFPAFILLSLFWLLPSSSFSTAGQGTDTQVDGDIFLPLVFSPPPVLEGFLANGGVVDGPDGVRIGTPQGSLAASVEVIFARPRRADSFAPGLR